ncbi:MAG: hypothetical protein II669_03230 [Elusimicrobia bacterium]|nr:hypothetical protein [Elusimicrobiota bacterium]
MYNGVIRQPAHNSAQMQTKYQMLTIEEEEVNGAIVENYVIRTKDFRADPNISVRDFDIVNLKKSGAFNDLKPTSLDLPIDKIAENAGTANQVLDIINELNTENNGKQQQQAQAEIQKTE